MARTSPFTAVKQMLGIKACDVWLLPCYALAFYLLHRAASPWAGAGYFSLWYPAAGLRLAMLWRRGARFAICLTAMEILDNAVSGNLASHGPALFADVISAGRPGVGYGLAVAIVRQMTRHRQGLLATPPMPLGLAAIAGPIANALLVIPTRAITAPGMAMSSIRLQMTVSLSGMAVGDLLGILVIAPPLLWLVATIKRGRLERPELHWPGRRQLWPFLQNGALIGGCLWLTVALWRAGLGLQPVPMLLIGTWTGLRYGRFGAWFAILAEVCLFLPPSALLLTDAQRLELHLGLAAAVFVTWLAGSFADAQNAANAVLERRNRLLFQAERLKTLRAMSVAVIHEISQPLSTLAIEASHLRAVTARLPPDIDGDIPQSAELIDKKARTLADLVRRLRRFGGRDVDTPSALPVEMLIDMARRIVIPELRRTDVRLQIGEIPSDLIVQAQEIELTQALVNLLRNAASAAPDGLIHLDVRQIGEEAQITLRNALGSPPAQTGHGMGVGLIIARTIVEAHGGTLRRKESDHAMAFTLTLPLSGGLHD